MCVRAAIYWQVGLILKLLEMMKWWLRFQWDSSFFLSLSLILLLFFTFWLLFSFSCFHFLRVLFSVAVDALTVSLKLYKKTKQNKKKSLSSVAFSFDSLFCLSQFISLSFTIFHVLNFLSLPQFLCSLCSSLYQPFCLHVLSFSPLPSVTLSVPLSALLSMASPLCFPPPVFFSLCSPRMHLFKACFTKTVLQQRERESHAWF